MTIRRVVHYCFLSEVEDSATGDHILMTVEEYRERIWSAWKDGGDSSEDYWFEESATRRQLDADLGEVKP